MNVESYVEQCRHKTFCITIQGVNNVGVRSKADVTLTSPVLAGYPANATLLAVRLGQKNVYGLKKLICFMNCIFLVAITKQNQAKDHVVLLPLHTVKRR